MTPALSDALSGHVTQYTVVGAGGGSHIPETMLLCLVVSFIMFCRPAIDTHGYPFLLISVELNSSYIFVFVELEIELRISQMLSKQALHPPALAASFVGTTVPCSLGHLLIDSWAPPSAFRLSQVTSDACPCSHGRLLWGST